MREAVIVSTARTPIGKAYRGAFNNTQGQELVGHALAQAVKRAGIDPAEIEDVVVGCAMQQGSTGGNVARQGLLRAGLPVTVPGMSIDRQCSSGLMAIATAAKQIVDDGMQITVGGGVESISLVQNDKMNRFRAADPWLVKNLPQIYMTMIETAEIVADRYGVSREAQDQYSLQSQQRTATGAGRRALRRRDRAADLDDDRHRQGNRRDLGEGSHAQARRRQPPEDHARRPASAAAGVQRRAADQGRPLHHRRQRLAAVRRRRGVGADGSEGSREARAQAARRVSRHDGRGVRSRRDGHRPGVRGAEAAEGSTA